MSFHAVIDHRVQLLTETSLVRRGSVVLGSQAADSIRDRVSEKLVTEPDCRCGSPDMVPCHSVNAPGDKTDPHSRPTFRKHGTLARNLGHLPIVRKDTLATRSISWEYDTTSRLTLLTSP